MTEVVREKRIVPLPEAEAQALIRKWYHVGDPIGNRECRLIGFGEKYVHRGGMNHKHAGVYIDFETLHVSSHGEGAARGYIPAPRWNPPPNEFDPRLTQPERLKMLDVFIKISDLPDTPFWEGDRVMFINDFHNNLDRQFAWEVTAFDYTDPKNIFCGLRKLPKANGLHKREDDGHVHVRTEVRNLFLIDHGNLWKMAHGEPMEFASIEKEAEFYHSLGMSKKVGEQGLLVTFEMALGWLNRGEVHEIKLKDKELMRFVAIKYDDAKFGGRIRAHTLAKLGFQESTPA